MAKDTWIPWIEVDFNDYNLTVIGRTNTFRKSYEQYYGEAPKVGDHVILYTMDDIPPFGYEAEVVSVSPGEDGETYLISHKIVDGPRFEFVPRKADVEEIREKLEQRKNNRRKDNDKFEKLKKANEKALRRMNYVRNILRRI